MSANDLKASLLVRADQSTNAKKDRSGWKIAYAKKQIIHNGRICLEKGDAALYDPLSFRKGHRRLVTVYLEKNLGGVDTTAYFTDFDYEQ